MPIVPATKVGPYEILASLGAGGMGEVYRARDTRLGRDIAIKFLPLVFSQNPERMRRFQQEARATGMLNHPNILAVYDIGSHEGQPYLVTELLEGETLRERIEERGVPPSKALNYAQQTARGLAAAHEKGITHRDLKPDNLFLTRDGTVKILDFGLAKMSPLQPDEGYDEAATVVGTESGLLLGTVGYMAPEQAMAKPVDHRADIFSLGVILYEMLSGQRAFHAATTVETMTLIIRGDPPALNIPKPLDSVLRRCLEKSPEERFQSAQDLGFALQAISAWVGSGSATAITASFPARVEWRSLLRRFAWPAAILLAACLGVVSSYLLLRGRSIALPSYTQVTFERGAVYSARFAPDGRSVVYSAQWSGRPIEVLAVEHAYPKSRSLISPAMVLAVAPSGQMAVLRDPRYIWHSQWKGTLADAPVAGGAPRDLRENTLEADYGPDGQLAAVTQDTEGGKYRLEYPIGKVLYETSGWISHPRVSPAGDRVAFLDHPAPSDDMGTLSIVDHAGKKTDLSPRWAATEGLAWNPRGDEVWFSASTAGPAYSVRAADLRGHVREVLTGAGGLVLNDIARDGRLLILRSNKRYEVRASIDDSGKERDLSWLDDAVPTDLSRDGKLMLFAEDSPAVGPNYATCLRKTDGSPVTRLGEGFSTAFSPDGKWTISFLPASPGQMMLLPIGAGQPRALERGPIESYGYTAGWFPDSQRILLGASEPGKPMRAFVQDISSGPPKPILKEGLILPRPVTISPDGKPVACQSEDRHWLLCSLTSDETRPLPSLAHSEQPAQWTADGKFLYVFDPHQMPLHLVKLEVATGRRQAFRDLAPSDLAGVHGPLYLAVTPDGRSIAYGYSRVLGDLFMVDAVK